VPDQPAERHVVDASGLVEVLIGSALGAAMRARMRGCELHAPAHLDAEVLSTLGRLHRAGEVPADAVEAALRELRSAPIVRHHLTDLLDGAWGARDRLRLVDALYLELARTLDAAVLSTDARLARASMTVELVTVS